MDKTDREKKEKTVTVAAALGVGFVCIIIGLPLWWKTTTVYRVQLPYSEISKLQSLKIVTKSHINVILSEASGNEKDLAKFQNKLGQALEGMNLIANNIWVEYEVSVKQATQEEKDKMLSSVTIEDLDKFLGAGFDRNVYNMVLMPKEAALKLSHPVVGNKRSCFIPFLQDSGDVVNHIVKAVKKVYINEEAIAQTVASVTGATHQKSDKESMRKVRSHPGFQLTFTLLNPQPDMVSAHWRIQSAVSDYLTPLLATFENFIELSVKSQYLHLLGVGTRPTRDVETGVSYLKHTDLPHIINPIEAYLGSHISTDPELNFVVFVPTRDQSPLKILDNEGKPTKSNSFLIPRWGGFMVYNTDVPQNSSLPHPVELNMKCIMEVFVSQIKLLLGITTKDLPTDILITQPGNDVIAEWEFDYWLRTHCIENVVSSIATLNSLADLLEKISNMVINDRIGSEVQKAVKYVHQTKHFMKDNNLKEAFVSSKRALAASEKAFFDQSLLELLYFPEDQKFAIYIPLFLPIGIPIVLSILQAIKYMMKKPSKTKAE